MKKYAIIFVTIIILVLLFACFTACGGEEVTEYKVRFIVDGKTRSVALIGGSEMVTIPRDPTKTGYEFEGWYLDKDIWQKPFTADYFIKNSITGDVNIYAKWKDLEEHHHLFNLQNPSEEYLKAPANCTTPAEYYYVCECGEAGTVCYEYGEALGHNFTDYLSNHNATCLEDGTKTASCDREGCTKTNTIVDEGLRWDTVSPITFLTITQLAPLTAQKPLHATTKVVPK